MMIFLKCNTKSFWWFIIFTIILLCVTKCVRQVETIGDAYMVVGGVPIPMSSHTERVANFALGMIIAAKEVTNPVTDGPIQVMQVIFD